MNSFTQLPKTEEIITLLQILSTSFPSSKHTITATAIRYPVNLKIIIENAANPTMPMLFLGLFKYFLRTRYAE